MQGTASFTVGFLSGYGLLVVATAVSPSVRLRLYGPLLPFLLGLWAAVPYLLQVAQLVPATELQDPLWNVFCLYPLLSAAAGQRTALTVVELDIGLMAAAYLHLLWRYLHLVQGAGKHHAQ